METNQKKGIWITVSILTVIVLGVIAVILWENYQEKIAKEEAQQQRKEERGEEMRQAKKQAEFERKFNAYYDEDLVCESSRQIVAEDLSGKIEFVRVPEGEELTIVVKGEEFTGTVKEESWIIKDGSDLKTKNGYLVNYVLSNFENYKKKGFDIIECPDTLVVGEWLEFLVNHEFDGKLNGWYPLKNLGDLDQNAELKDYVFLNSECKPKFMAINNETGEIIPLNWSGQCWSKRWMSAARRGEKFFPESLKLKYLTSDEMPRPEIQLVPQI